ncbi:MAG TPA: SRPBCC family protein [Acidimicrobiales bacterium]|nr:SRPBCC family protein [Acidimicrobiales bacterium]
MAAGQVEIEVAAPPDAVWAKVGDFAGVGAMFPALEGLRLEGDDRVLTMFGMEIRERLVDRDDAARTLTYAIVDGVPVERHQATVSVAPSGDGSLVTWSVEATPDEMLPVFTDTYGNALKVLADSFG